MWRLYILSCVWSWHAFIFQAKLGRGRWYIYIYNVALEEEFEDTKGAIRNRISKKNIQHNGQKKKYKRTNNDPQNIHIKLKICELLDIEVKKPRTCGRQTMSDNVQAEGSEDYFRKSITRGQN